MINEQRPERAAEGNTDFVSSCGVIVKGVERVIDIIKADKEAAQRQVGVPYAGTEGVEDLAKKAPPPTHPIVNYPA